MRGLVLNQYLVLLVLMRSGVLTIDELNNRMIFVGGSPVGKVFFALEADGLVESLLDVRIDVMEGFVLEVPLAFLDVLVGGDLVSVLCPVFNFLLLLGGLIVSQGRPLLVGHAHH